MADLKRAKLATKIHNSKYKPLTVDKPGTHHAIVGTKNKNVYHGGSTSISIYNPKVKGTQYSSARIKVQNYPDSIEVGWTVNPTLYNDTRTRLYTFTKDSSNGNWFLKFGQDETVIGFWPKNVFTALGDEANYVEWGGEVFSPPGVPSPPMGSGQIKTINETDYVVNAVDTESFSDIVQYQVIDEGRVGADQHLVLFGGVGGHIGK
ncbi:protein neprosin-like [Castanea sativa]|uniref:protein neprosin-like n=1 Tax=Castanea sativa TaxID=21020 RepID=UPI003F653028